MSGQIWRRCRRLKLGCLVFLCLWHGRLQGAGLSSRCRSPGTSQWDRTITHFFYGGDQHYRLCQEAILGIGGVKLLRTLGYDNIERFHMNEGYPSLLTLELLDEEAKKAGRGAINHDVEAVRQKCVHDPYSSSGRTRSVSPRSADLCSRSPRNLLLSGIVRYCTAIYPGMADHEHHEG